MRLNRIAKEFNVGVQTLVEFLEKKAGVTVEGPMANVTDEQYEMLRKEFNKDKSVKEESERERQERQHTREKIKEETKAAPEKAQTPSEKSMSNVGLKVVGQIDLNPKKEEAPKPKPVEKPAPAAQPAPVEKKVEKKAEKPAEPAPANQPEAKSEAPKPKSAEKPAPAAPAAAPKKPNQTAMGERSRDRINDDPLPKEARNGEVFRVEVADVPQVNVVGHIDLNSINQSTRPKKKSKEERKKAV